MVDKDPKPELLPGPDGPTAPPHREITCPDCGATFETRIDLLRETEDLSEMTTRTDYWCPECGAHLGTTTDYHGPVPVEIGPGIYELQ